jgi:hypothetical protein
MDGDIDDRPGNTGGLIPDYTRIPPTGRPVRPLAPELRLAYEQDPLAA